MLKGFLIETDDIQNISSLKQMNLKVNSQIAKQFFLPTHDMPHKIVSLHVLSSMFYILVWSGCTPHGHRTRAICTYKEDRHMYIYMTKNLKKICVCKPPNIKLHGVLTFFMLDKSF